MHLLTPILHQMPTPASVLCRTCDSTVAKPECKHQDNALGSQNDILGHPSVQAFVMQAGINSLYEAAYHATPVVSVPLVTDQVDNAAKVRVICILM